MEILITRKFFSIPHFIEVISILSQGGNPDIKGKAAVCRPLQPIVMRFSVCCPTACNAVRDLQAITVLARRSSGQRLD